MNRLSTTHISRGEPLTIYCDGIPLRAYKGESIAAALYANNIRLISRSSKYHRPRGAFCFEGHCGSCLMHVNDVPNTKACMQSCDDGMIIETQNKFPTINVDIFESIDVLFHRGLNHHRFMTQTKLFTDITHKIAVKLCGLGVLPDTSLQEKISVVSHSPDILIVGGGPAGLSAATAAATTNTDVWLIDEHKQLGGSALTDPKYGHAWAQEKTVQLLQANVTLKTQTSLIGVYPEDHNGLWVAVAPESIFVLTPKQIIYATGGYAVNRLFPNNDRPGIMSARAIGRLFVSHQISPGTNIVLVGNDPFVIRLKTALEKKNHRVTLIDDTQPFSVIGHNHIQAIVLEGDTNKTLPCDVLGIWLPPSPASEYAREQGCQIDCNSAQGGYCITVNEHQETSVSGTFACGDVCGHCDPQLAIQQGIKAGQVCAERVHHV